MENCQYGTCDITSGRITTREKFEQTYGKFEAKIKMPAGQGLWPAFWMMGNNVDTAGWPNNGEIDIMEIIGSEPSTLYGTVHGPGYSGEDGIGGSTTLPGGAKFADDFHLFAVEWSPEQIIWTLDGTQYLSLKKSQLPAGKRWVFDHPFYLLLNLAVGGVWPGPPNAQTKFPATLLVDYVRVYTKA
jgi:beta-glucanase (GH16 family)